LYFFLSRFGPGSFAQTSPTVLITPSERRRLERFTSGDYYCELSDLQRILYDDFSRSQARAAAEDVIQSAQATKSGDQQHVFQSLQYLRKLCNHPALVLKGDSQINAALNKVRKSGGLNDIQHAPKLLALR
jgi:TATA-binding protein-associated factor